MKVLSLCFAALCALSVSASAAPRTENPIMHYYKEMAKQPSAVDSLLGNADARDCNPGHGERKGCVKTVCDLGAYNCSYSHNLEKVVEMCRGDVEGECFEAMCKMGAYNCSYSHNVEKVAQLCKNANGRCVKVVCELGAYNCSYSHNLDKVVQLCQGGARGSCIKDMCSTGAYNCSYSHNVDKVLELCKR